MHNTLKQIEIKKTECLPVFNAALEQCPRILDQLKNPEDSIRRSQEVIAEYEIEPSCFERTPENAAYLISLTSILDTAKTEEEKQRIESSIILLAYGHSEKLQTLYPQFKEYDENRFGDAYRTSVYDEYTDHELSKTLHDHITSTHLLDDVRETLGVSEENERPFQIRVLDIASKQDYFMPVLHTVHDDEASQFKQHLIGNGKAMAKTLGEEHPPANAYATLVGGEMTIVVTRLTAETLLNSDVNVQLGKDATDTLKHEYVHSQRETIGEQELMNAHFGVAMEEVRAEEFSGNTLGYQSTKDFFNTLSLLSGSSITEMMRENQNGGSALDHYQMLVEEFGIQNALDITQVAPPEYKDTLTQNPHSAFVQEQIGSFNDILDRIYLNLEDSQREYLQVRIESTAQKYATIFRNSNMSVDDYLRVKSPLSKLMQAVFEKTRAYLDD